MGRKCGTVYIASLPSAVVRDLSIWEQLAQEDRERLSRTVHDTFAPSCDFTDMDRLDPTDQLPPVRELFDSLYNPIGDTSITVPGLNWSRLLKVRSKKGVGFLALPADVSCSWTEWFLGWIGETAQRCVLLTCPGEFPEPRGDTAE